MDNRATNVHDLLSLKIRIRVIDWKIVIERTFRVRPNLSSSTELVKFHKFRFDSFDHY